MGYHFQLELLQVLSDGTHNDRGENWLVLFEPCIHSIMHTSHHTGSISAKTNQFRHQKPFVIHVRYQSSFNGISSTVFP